MTTIGALTECDTEGSDFVEVEVSDVHGSLDDCADVDAARGLKRLMECISEDYYCAGWMSGLEYSLFSAAYAGEDFNSGLTHDERSQLITLSQRCQGWWMCGRFYHKREFVPFDRWFEIYSKRFQPC